MRCITKYGLIILLLLSIIGTSFYVVNNDNEILYLATTTSVDNTGLLDLLIAKFQESNDMDIRVTAVGSGAAIDLGRKGEVDAILVHAPTQELELMNEGYGESRTSLWYNYFIVIGPSSDPANIHTETNVKQVFEKILIKGRLGEVNFYSRGDDSGTHIKEKTIWEGAGLEITENDKLTWYKETGQGMSATLTIANEDSAKAYVLTDLGTFAKIANSEIYFDLIKLFEQSDELYNLYSYIVISPEKYPDLNTEGANEFLDFLIQPSTLDLVRNFKEGEYALFTPIEE
ncbi:MAG: substrate-binding domain-containing protein [Candidatus Heimdallarchaeota archaeon]|nr:substrate-binding domain-containing protein [Candidatus Heimdallarchaeota archaeon]MDH5645137.1 substrate-binding domain-containing protein [Candidatus Heimdallarchaeota archaeon]